MSELSRAEQARYIYLQLQGAEEDGSVQSCLFYHKNWDVYFVTTKKEPDDEHTEKVEEIVEGTNLDYGSHHPTPPAEHIVTGDDLQVTAALIEATAAFLQWVDREGSDNEPVLIMPGALLIAWIDDDNPDHSVRGEIVFPVGDENLDKDRLRDQALFATKLINRLSRTMGVVLNGYEIEDVIPGMSSGDVYKQYLAASKSDKGPVIPDLVDEAIDTLKLQLQLLLDWKGAPPKQRPLLPDDWELMHCGNGIIGCQDEGLVILAGDDTNMPSDVLDRLRDQDLLY